MDRQAADVPRASQAHAPCPARSSLRSQHGAPTPPARPPSLPGAGRLGGLDRAAGLVGVAVPSAPGPLGGSPGVLRGGKSSSHVTLGFCAPES
jgi:hypothetical protein